MNGELVLQMGAVVGTILTTFIGIFKFLIPKLLDSYEKRLEDKDKFLEVQSDALNAVVKERKEASDKNIETLESIAQTNIKSMQDVSSHLKDLSNMVKIHNESSVTIQREMVQVVERCSINQRG